MNHQSAPLRSALLDGVPSDPAPDHCITDSRFDHRTPVGSRRTQMKSSDTVAAAAESRV